MEPNASANQDRLKDSRKFVSETGNDPGRTGSDGATEQLLLAQIRRQNPRSSRALWRRLIWLYSDNGKADKTAWGLRQLLAVERGVEGKAACLLAIGGQAEMRGDYARAVGFYRQALAMEPMRPDTWYLIHNNLGHTLNRLGQFTEAEYVCKAAVDIEPTRPEAHQNLGLALRGQLRYDEAARSFIRATEAWPCNPRASQLLLRLIRERHELEFEFGGEAERCQEWVRFAQWAVQRALSGNRLRVVLGCNEPILDELITVPLRRMTGGAVETVTSDSWTEILQAVGPGPCDLVFVIPQNMPGAQWNGIRCLRTIKARGTKSLVVCGTEDELAEHGSACEQAGADEFVEVPFLMDQIEETLRQSLARK